MLISMTSADHQRLQAYRTRHRQLVSELTQIGFISAGSLIRRYMPCGKPGCRCQADPPHLHGPYWQLSQRVGGKTVTRRLTEAEAALYQEWIANRRRLKQTVATMAQISEKAGRILLRQTAADGRTR